MVSRARHWKQRWDADANLVFARRMRMGDNPNKPFCLPGERVTKKMRTKIGLHRLRRWFETGVLEISDWKAPEPQRERALAAAEAEVKTEERVNDAPETETE